MSEKKQRAPTLYAIIAIKLLKWFLFLSLAIVAYALSDNDLPIEYRQLLHWLRFNPERKFFSDLPSKLAKLTEVNALVAAGTLVYSLFSWLKEWG
jgi:hypothetical protein